MKSPILSLTIAAVLAASTPALAQDTAPAAEQSQPSKPKADKKRLFKAGGIGCITGGALAYLTGNKKKALASCAVGAAVGSGVGVGVTSTYVLSLSASLSDSASEVSVLVTTGVVYVTTSFSLVCLATFVTVGRSSSVMQLWVRM